MKIQEVFNQLEIQIASYNDSKFMYDFDQVTAIQELFSIAREELAGKSEDKDFKTFAKLQDRFAEASIAKINKKIRPLQTLLNVQI